MIRIAAFSATARSRSHGDFARVCAEPFAFWLVLQSDATEKGISYKVGVS